MVITKTDANKVTVIGIVVLTMWDRQISNPEFAAKYIYIYCHSLANRIIKLIPICDRELHDAMQLADTLRTPKER